MPIELIPLALLSPVLVATAYCDLRHMRIPNALSLIFLTVFLLSAPFLLSGDEVLFRLTTSAAFLAIGFGLFALRLIGGGDVKILSALLLFVPSATISAFMFLFSTTMVLGIALMPLLRALPGAGGSGWVSLQPSAGFPMGISIAMAGLAHPPAMAILLS